MAFSADDNTETGRKTARPSLAAHPAFPLVIALWCAVLLGVGSLLFSLAPLESLISFTGIAGLAEFLAPPLGTKARWIIALAAAGIGGWMGFRAAHYVQFNYGFNTGPVDPFARGLRNPVDPRRELADTGILTETDPDILDRQAGGADFDNPLFGGFEAFEDETEDGPGAQEPGNQDDALASSFAGIAGRGLAEPQVFDVTEAQILEEGAWEEEDEDTDTATAVSRAEFAEFEADDEEAGQAIQADESAERLADHDAPDEEDFADEELAQEPESTIDETQIDQTPVDQTPVDQALTALKEAAEGEEDPDLAALVQKARDTLQRYRQWKFEKAPVAAPVLHAVRQGQQPADEIAGLPVAEAPDFRVDEGADSGLPEAPAEGTHFIAPAVDEADDDFIPDELSSPEVASLVGDADDAQAMHEQRTDDDDLIDAVFGDLPGAFDIAYAEDTKVHFEADETSPSDEGSEDDFEVVGEDAEEIFEPSAPEPESHAAEPDDKDFERFESVDWRPEPDQPVAEQHLADEAYAAEAYADEAYADETFAADLPLPEDSAPGPADSEAELAAGLPAGIAENSQSEIGQQVDQVDREAWQRSEAPFPAIGGYLQESPLPSEGEEVDEEYDDLSNSLVLPIHRKGAARVSFGDMGAELLKDYENGYEDEEEEEEDPEADSSYGSLLSMPSKYSAPVSLDSRTGAAIPRGFGDESEEDDLSGFDHVTEPETAEANVSVLVQKGQAARAPSLDAVSASTMRAKESASNGSTSEQEAALRDALMHLQRMNASN